MSKSKRQFKPIGQKKKEQGSSPFLGNLPFKPNLLSIVIGLLLAAITLTVFWPVSHFEFINIDDNEYVTENPHVQQGFTLRSLIWAFGSTHACNWHPFTWLSHMLDVELYGLKPGGHHLTNLLFHIANTLFLFLILKRMTGAVWRSSFVSALFALHPLHVESVAWVAERKDVLSTFFWMLTLWGYAYYAEKPNLRRYGLVFFSFVAGLLSKPMVVTLPFVLLLLDYWPLGRLKFEQASGYHTPHLNKSTNFRDFRKRVFCLFLEKIPLFALTALSCFLTIFAQEKGGALGSLELVPLLTRMANALVSYATYIGKMIWPSGLAVFYPYPDRFPIWQLAGAGLLLVGVSLLVILAARKHPYLGVGWFWYVGTLVPVIGLVQVGDQAMADRYTYIPLIGLFMMIAWGIPDLLARSRYRRAIVALSAGVVIVVLAVVSRLQIAHWENSVSLLQHTLSVAKSPLVHNNLGLALDHQGRNQEAVAHFTEALRLNPSDVRAHKNLGRSLAREGNIEEASRHYEKVLRLTPEDAEAHYRMGFLLSRQGKEKEAIFHYRQAIRVQPSHADTHNNLGVLFARQGKTQEAISHFSEVLRIQPYNAEAHSNLANCLLDGGRIEEAITHYAEALRIKPGLVIVRYGLANALVRQGKIKEAIAQYTEFLRLRPDFAEAHLALGLAYITIGDRQSAMKQYRILREMHPALADRIAPKLFK